MYAPDRAHNLFNTDSYRHSAAGTALQTVNSTRKLPVDIYETHLKNNNAVPTFRGR